MRGSTLLHSCCQDLRSGDHCDTQHLDLRQSASYPLTSRYLMAACNRNTPFKLTIYTPITLPWFSSPSHLHTLAKFITVCR